MTDWKIFQGTGKPNPDENIVLNKLPEAPQWRQFSGNETVSASRQQRRGVTFQTPPEVVELVNAALYLRRPLLVTGKPGIGKTSLAYAVAHELHLGEVLTWPITTKTTLKDGLYRYDAIGRLQEAQRKEQENALEISDIGDFIQLGPLGTALLDSDLPRVLLIDEIDKSDIDLPNDLLHIFEEGEFEIPELSRLKIEPNVVNVRTAYTSSQEVRKASVRNGSVRCRSFPFVVLTSNGEKDFPPPFLRRCIRLNMQEPGKDYLTRIVAAHLGEKAAKEAESLIQHFLNRREHISSGDLATDQLLNAVYLVTGKKAPEGEERKRLLDRLLAYLNGDI